MRLADACLLLLLNSLNLLPFATWPGDRAATGRIFVQ